MEGTFTKGNLQFFIFWSKSGYSHGMLKYAIPESYLIVTNKHPLPFLWNCVYTFDSKVYEKVMQNYDKIYGDCHCMPA